ncbi:MAG: hypothetical protein AB7Y46_09155 [Armatimonadota bacterium]
MATAPWRLAVEAPQLLAELERADERGRRVVAAAVARLAVEHVGLDDPTVARALDVLDRHSAEEVDVLTREAMAALVERLDETYRQLRGQARTGETAHGDAARCLARLQAASAVLFALREDAMEAAAEASYEAIRALGGAGAVRAAAVDALDAYETESGAAGTARALRRAQRLTMRRLPLHAAIAVIVLVAIALASRWVGLPDWAKAILIALALFPAVWDLVHYVLCARRLRELAAQPPPPGNGASPEA